MLSLFNYLPQYWTDGAIRYLEGLRNGLTEPFPLTEDIPPATPYEVLYEEGKVRLRYYQAAGTSRQSVPLLLVYALIKRPYILDLLPDKLRPGTLDQITATYGNCPAWFMKAAFTAMSPVHHALDKYMGLYRNQDKEGYAEMFTRFERWMNSGVPLAGQLFREVTQDIF